MKKRIPIFSVIAIATVLIINTIYSFLFIYHIKLNGKDNIVVNINENYKDEGVSVKYRGKKYGNYKTINTVNTHKPGKYKVLYSVSNKTIERHIEVKDIESPKLSIEESNKTIEYGNKYEMPKYTAIDNYDGDITDNVQVNGTVDINKLGKYEINYTVKDSSNNNTHIVNVINVVDTQKPEIKLDSSIKDYAILNKELDINNFKAIDNYDGDITSNVKVESNLDISKKGIYTVTYTVKDSSNNETTLTKTINVQEKNTKGIPVLMYHWFYDDTKGEKPGESNPHNYVSKTNLENQLKFLKENNYYFPTWNELGKYIDGKIDLPKNSVIVTDDDCVPSFFNVALPVFQEYEIPITSFCITSKNKWKNYTKEPYLDFESHTDSLHVRKCNKEENKKHWDGAVMCSSYETIYKDITKSVQLVGNNNAFAYPFGHYNNNTITALKKNNIKYAFTINNGKVKRNTDKYKLPRIRISKSTTLEEFKHKLK